MAESIDPRSGYYSNELFVINNVDRVCAQCWRSAEVRIGCSELGRPGVIFECHGESEFVEIGTAESRHVKALNRIKAFDPKRKLLGLGKTLSGPEVDAKMARQTKIKDRDAIAIFEEKARELAEQWSEGQADRLLRQELEAAKEIIRKYNIAAMEEYLAAEPAPSQVVNDDLTKSPEIKPRKIRFED